MATSSKDLDKVTQAKILANLAVLGGQRVQDDAVVYEGTKLILPEQYQGQPMQKVVNFLVEYEEEQENKFNISRNFQYHPFDVANAFQLVLKDVFGTTGFGQTTYDMFGGEHPPEFKTVSIGAGQTVQVPWGHFKLPILNATFVIDVTRDRTGQLVGYLVCEAPKKFRSQVDGVFKAVEQRLTEVSLFRGKAIDANWMEPEFLDLTGVDESKVAYSAETIRQIDANIWTVVEHTAAVQAAGMKLKRAVLLEGPYGTGKSLTGLLTAKKAVANGWTFVYCRPGQDLAQALHAAKLLAPSVVFFEDLDVIAEPGAGQDQDRVSKLLDQFDGISNKTSPVLAVLTTNHVDRLHRGMLRPGRLDAVVHIGELDAAGVRVLIDSVLPERLRGTINYDEVFIEMEGFLPAFIKEAAERALRYSIARTKGRPEPVSTVDLVAAATGLRPQLDLMNGAGEKKDRPSLDEALGDLVDGRLGKVVVVDNDNPDYVESRLKIQETSTK